MWLFVVIEIIRNLLVLEANCLIFILSNIYSIFESIHSYQNSKSPQTFFLFVCRLRNRLQGKFQS